jgi:hypothetical protein
MVWYVGGVQIEPCYEHAVTQLKVALAPTAFMALNGKSVLIQTHSKPNKKVLAWIKYSPDVSMTTVINPLTQNDL